MLLKSCFAVIFALLAQHAVRLWFFLDYHKSRTIIHHRPGPCRQLDGADGGSEDLTVLDNGLTFIASGSYPWTRGRILLFNFSNPFEDAKELPIISSSLNKSDLVLYGLSTWRDSLTGEITLMVINHAGHHDRVEVFTFQEDSLTLLHVNSILSPKRNYMNDLVMTSNRTFYITEYGEMRDNPLLEMLLMLSYCDILYYNGSEFRSVAHGLRMANGINVSPDHRYLYVAELGRKQLKSYRIKDTELEHVEDLFLDTLLDNIEIDPVTGNLWVGCHPVNNALMMLENYDLGTVAPSQILRVSATDGKFTDAVEVYSDTGSELTASSVASVYQGKMIAGSIMSQLIVCDLVYDY